MSLLVVLFVIFLDHCFCTGIKIAPYLPVVFQGPLFLGHAVHCGVSASGWYEMGGAPQKGVTTFLHNSTFLLTHLEKYAALTEKTSRKQPTYLTMKEFLKKVTTLLAYNLYLDILTELTVISETFQRCKTLSKAPKDNSFAEICIPNDTIVV